MNRLAVSIHVLGLSIVLSSLGCQPQERSPTEPPRVAGWLRGQVVADGQPVARARVGVQGRAERVTTDERGQFALPWPVAPTDRQPTDTRTSTESPTPPPAARTTSQSATNALAAHDAAQTPLRIVAFRDGHKIGSGLSDQNPLVISLTRLPTTDHEAYPWVNPHPAADDPQRCGNCHREIYDEWQTGGHARGLANRHFLGLYTGSNWQGDHGHGWSLLDEYPEGAGVCASCHTPAAAIDHLLLGDIRQVDKLAAQGVHCDFCHKIQDVQPDINGLTHGRFGVQLLRPAEGQLFFGPLDDVDRGEDTFSAVQRESHYCASCHEGILFGVPVYTTFSEWQERPAHLADRTCQSCHMRPTGQMHNFAPDAGGIDRDPATLASHQLFPGGQDAMLRRAVHVDVQTESLDSALRVNVTLSLRDVAHRVPTGFIDRHLILSVVATDADGQSVELREGPRLSHLAGESAEQPGTIFGRWRVGEDGTTPWLAPFWQPGGTWIDTRLDPRETRQSAFVFAPGAASVRIELRYHRFWSTVAREKQWPDESVLVFAQMQAVLPPNNP